MPVAGVLGVLSLPINQASTHWRLGGLGLTDPAERRQPYKRPKSEGYGPVKEIPEPGYSEKRHLIKPEMALSTQTGDSSQNPPLRKKKPSGAERRKRKAAEEAAMAQVGSSHNQEKAIREAGEAKPAKNSIKLSGKLLKLNRAPAKRRIRLSGKLLKL
ncbi:hypothetical protein Trydic_g9911 [Trypoxylus dichotomus]